MSNPEFGCIHLFKAIDGWLIKVYSPKIHGGYLTSGPTKTKPSKAKLMKLQNRYFEGRKVSVFEET